MSEHPRKPIATLKKGKGRRQAGSAIKETKRRVSTRAARNRSALDAVNAALGIRRNNQTTDSNN